MFSILRNDLLWYFPSSLGVANPVSVPRVSSRNKHTQNATLYSIYLRSFLIFYEKKYKIEWNKNAIWIINLKKNIFFIICTFLCNLFLFLSRVYKVSLYNLFYIPKLRQIDVKRVECRGPVEETITDRYLKGSDSERHNK